jgi:hypothetical protein
MSQHILFFHYLFCFFLLHITYLNCNSIKILFTFLSFRPDERKGGRIGNKRKIRVRLDPAQYYADMRDGHDCYSRLNLLVRRKPKENNFKAILETIRDLMNTPALNRAIPSWLHDVFLGYGSPKAANYRYNNVPL